MIIGSSELYKPYSYINDVENWVAEGRFPYIAYLQVMRPEDSDSDKFPGCVFDAPLFDEDGTRMQTVITLEPATGQRCLISN